MKKVIVALILMGLVAGLLTSCSQAPEAPTTSLPKSGITVEEILENFEGMLEPIADQFKMTRLAEVELEDGRVCQPVLVTDKLLDRNYHIHIYSQEGSATDVLLSAGRDKRAELNFALLSLYICKSMNLPELETEAFYDHFKLLTEAPEGSMTVEGWDLLAFTTEDLLTFSVLYATE